MTDTAARPAPNENHLLINAYSTHPQSPLLAVTRRIADSGCNLVDTRLATVGRDVSVTALATGPWDAVAKLETMLTKLEREEGLKLIWYRTGPKPVQSSLLPVSYTHLDVYKRQVGGRPRGSTADTYAPSPTLVTRPPNSAPMLSTS